MPHITIKLSAPPIGSKSVTEIVRIKTPENMFSFSDSIVVETEPESLDKTGFVGWSDTCVCTSEITKNKDWQELKDDEVNETSLRNAEKMVSKFPLDSCAGPQYDSGGRQNSKNELEVRKDTATVKSCLEEFKFRKEEELKSETEAHEQKRKILEEKIQSLEYKEKEKTKRVEELENSILVYRDDYEKCMKEVEELRKMVNEFQSELYKQRLDANTANDQAVEARNQMELLVKKIQSCEKEKEQIQQEWKCEAAEYCRELLELRTFAVENLEKVDSERKDRIELLVVSHEDLDREEQLSGGSNKVDDNGSKMDSNISEPHMSLLSKELNEMFGENLSSQENLSELTRVLTATQKELEQVRSQYQVKNRAFQDLKQKFDHLHDGMSALAEENKQLRNSLGKKCADFRNIRRKFLVSETEVSWLKEALNIVDNPKKKTVCSEVMKIAR